MNPIQSPGVDLSKLPETIEKLTMLLKRAEAGEMTCEDGSLFVNGGYVGCLANLDDFPCIDHDDPDEVARVNAQCDAMEDIVVELHNHAQLLLQVARHHLEMVREMENSAGVALIAAERERQVSKEGWTAEHDALEDGGGLALAAACYAMPEKDREMHGSGVYHAYHGTDPEYKVPKLWPWEPSWFKPSPTDRVRELVKAGALIAAEIDRIKALD